MERDKRIELSPPPWQGGVLPLYESRVRSNQPWSEAFIACWHRGDKAGPGPGRKSSRHNSLPRLNRTDFSREVSGEASRPCPLPESLVFPPEGPRPSAAPHPAPLARSLPSDTSAARVRCGFPSIHAPYSSACLASSDFDQKRHLHRCWIHGLALSLLPFKVHVSSRSGRLPVPSLGRKVFWLAQASISVHSTVKCSSDINGLALSSTRWKNDSATSSFSKRSRFLLYTA